MKRNRGIVPNVQERKEPNQTFVADRSTVRQQCPPETFGADPSILLGNEKRKAK